MHPNYQLNKNQILINDAIAQTEFCLILYVENTTNTILMQRGEQQVCDLKM